MSTLWYALSVPNGTLDNPEGSKRSGGSRQVRSSFKSRKWLKKDKRVLSTPTGTGLYVYNEAPNVRLIYSQTLTTLATNQARKDYLERFGMYCNHAYKIEPWAIKKWWPAR